MTRMFMTFATFLTLTAAHAALPPPVDFAGQWVGTATERGTHAHWAAYPLARGHAERPEVPGLRDARRGPVHHLPCG